MSRKSDSLMKIVAIKLIEGYEQFITFRNINRYLN